MGKMLCGRLVLFTGFQRLSLVKHQLLLKVGMKQTHKACVSSEIEEFEKYLKEANS